MKPHTDRFDFVMRTFACILLTTVIATVAEGYVTPAPRYIEVEITFQDPKTGEERMEPGQLWFGDLPVVREDGKVVGFGKTAHYQGIKWFVPKDPGEIWIVRPTTDLGPQVMILHDYCGERPIKLAFDRIGVGRTVDAQLGSKMDETAKAVTSARPVTDLKVPDTSDILQGDNVIAEPVASTIGRDADQNAVKTAEQAPLQFATKEDIGFKDLPVANLRKIVFLKASDGIKRDPYGGRFVEYATRATGDEGRVQVAAATFFGGPLDGERFTFAEFVGDKAILAGGAFHDLSFTDQSLIRVIGPDAKPDAYPPVEKLDNRNRPYTEYPKQTPVFVRFSSDLKKIEEIFRLPWGTGSMGSVILGADGSLYLAGIVGPHFETLAKTAKRSDVVENPDALKPDAKGRTPVPGPDGYVLKISPDHKSVEWMVQFKYAWVYMFLQTDGSVTCRRGDKMFFIDPSGKPSPGPTLEITGNATAMDVRTGAIYMGGAYRSGTGREPYVCPYLYKVNAQGKIEWTGYSWSGPIVGVDQLRLVSDSQISKILVREDGHLLISGWSDGGNTVLAYQPYDLRIKVKASGGFCSSTWGASGLTVRIANLITMNPNSMETEFHTQYVGYVPTSDLPTLINIYGIYPMANGEVAVTGGSWLGFVETHDAWTTPWYIENRTDEHVMARGGVFFTLFTPDFKKARIATFTPHVHGLQIAGRGKMLLLYGSADDKAPDAVDQKWDRQYSTIVRHAIQPKLSGKSDAYLMLVDTQGPPNPPVIPEKTWGIKNKKGAK
jgi:hypothetical protein